MIILYSYLQSQKAGPSWCLSYGKLPIANNFNVGNSRYTISPFPFLPFRFSFTSAGHRRLCPNLMQQFRQQQIFVMRLTRLLVTLYSVDSSHSPFPRLLASPIFIFTNSFVVSTAYNILDLHQHSPTHPAHHPIICSKGVTYPMRKRQKEPHAVDVPMEATYLTRMFSYMCVCVNLCLCPSIGGYPGCFFQYLGHPTVLWVLRAYSCLAHFLVEFSGPSIGDT
ncbi:hypothetical protein F5Y06DRAFT_223946 [Hypoxylon sp. FL0890]|nr:hypothetical protein F5Y06DRAFT_223946 [Hypoxylon sp. FL0890]